MNQNLLQKLQAFAFDDPTAGLSFSKRLSRENNWSTEYTQRVLEEYRRFLYLCCEAGHPVTPSEAVDQAWHLHLCYTESYWQDLCQDTLGKPIHHGPTKGGQKERTKFDDWYSKTLESYRLAFAEEPPSDIWLPNQLRFAPQKVQRVDRNTHFVIKKNTAYAGMIAVVASLGLASCNTISDASGLILGVFILSIFVSIISKAAKHDTRNNKKHKRGYTDSTHNGSHGCSTYSNDGSDSSGHDSGDSGCASACGGGGCGGGGCGGGGD